MLNYIRELFSVVNKNVHFIKKIAEVCEKVLFMSVVNKNVQFIIHTQKDEQIKIVGSIPVYGNLKTFIQGG